MRHTVTKVFTVFGHEKEEAWINQMSAKGLSLVKVSFCRYTFVDSEPDEYIYQLYYMPHYPKHPESVQFMRFLEEMGIEVVDTYLSWIYLRRRASEGPFELYSDIPSQINTYKRLLAAFLPLACLEWLIGLQNLLHWQDHHGIPNLVLGILLMALGILFTWGSLSLYRKIRRLRREALLRE